MVIEVNVREEGFTLVRELLRRKIPEVIAEATKDVATTMRNLALGRTPVKSGHLKRSWSPVTLTPEGFAFGTSVSYAETLEEGGYTNVGPRTVAVEDGIYSRQAPGGILGPLVEDPEVLRRVTELVVSEIDKGLDEIDA